jgi:hypothetical protein
MCGFGLGMFVANLELPSDLAGLDSHEKIIVTATEIWLIIHYVIALTTLPILAINFLKERTKPPFKSLPLAFSGGFVCASMLMALIHVLTQIVIT